MLASLVESSGGMSLQRLSNLLLLIIISMIMLHITKHHLLGCKSLLTVRLSGSNGGEEGFIEETLCQRGERSAELVGGQDDIVGGSRRSAGGRKTCW